MSETGKRPSPTGRAAWHGMFGTYVTVENGEPYLSCGQDDCDWLHRLGTPFLLGGAVEVAAQHAETVHGFTEAQGGR